MHGIDKKALVAELRRRLSQSLESLRASQHAAQVAAVHPEAKQEGSKDMRATEASYVARGLAERVERLRDDILAVERMPVRAFEADEPASSGALVSTIDRNGAESLYLLAPAGGGERLPSGDRDVVVVTIVSPLGQVLAGCRTGDAVAAELPGRRSELEITGIE